MSPSKALGLLAQKNCHRHPLSFIYEFLFLGCLLLFASHVHAFPPQQFTDPSLMRTAKAPHQECEGPLCHSESICSHCGGGPSCDHLGTPKLLSLIP